MSTENKSLELNKLLAGAQLPALPQSAIVLLQLSQDLTNGPAEYAVPIESDPGLAGQVLRFVNSSYFGFSREISSVKLAITLVGVRTIKNFALWSAVFSLMPNPKCGPFDVKSLWRDSLRRGLFARTIGKLMKQDDAEDWFAAALLQDMAIPILAKELPDIYHKMFEVRQESGLPLSHQEKERFGWTHAEAAAELARIWKLPSRFNDMILMHSRLNDLLESPEATKGQLAVALASLLPTDCDDNWSDREAFITAYHRICGKDAIDLTELFSEVDKYFAEFAPLLNLTAATTPLVDCLTPGSGAILSE
ncbi:MAG: HDOD domain-containing protein [Planctomycetes bacterium]|nr:HDOD domain-containing protein [Planctomycetota bacterium]